MHILVAPNAFKNSLSAEEVAFAIRDGLLASRLDCTIECFPIGDGGDGTDDLIIKKCGGVLVNTKVHDPLGNIITATYGIIGDGKTAVIGMSKAAGLNLLQPSGLDPLKATSFGTGQQISMALDRGATKIIIGMGGSATVDGGAGILSALGARFTDGEGRELSGPGTFGQLASVDVAGLDKRVFGCELIVLCDVENFLLGEKGAATVFGPQKGASGHAIVILERSLQQFTQVVLLQTGKDIAAIRYGGTAGGAAAGLYGLLGANLVNGIDHYLQLTNFDSALEHADLVITGEGSIDEQTLQGKGPFGVAQRAHSKGIPVIAIAGKVPLVQHKDLQKHFDVLLPIAHEPCDLATALRCTPENIRRTARELGNLLFIDKQLKYNLDGLDTGD